MTDGDDVELEVLEELVLAWRNAQKAGNTITLLAREHYTIGIALYGLTAHAVNLCETITQLARSNNRAALVPLVRLVVECGATAIWVDLGGHLAAQALMAEQSRQLRNLVDAFVKAGYDDRPEVRASIAEDLARLPASPAGRHFESRCAEILGGEGIYAMYRVASETSHAGTAIVDLYLGQGRNLGIPKFLHHPDVENVHGWLGIALTMLVHAWLSLDAVQKGHPMRRRLREVARELGFDPKHAYTALGARQDRERQRTDRALRRATVTSDPEAPTPPT